MWHIIAGEATGGSGPFTGNETADIFIWLGLIGGGVLSAGGLFKFIIKPLKKMGDFVDDWFGVPDRPGVPGRLGVMPRLVAVENRSQVTEENVAMLHRDVRELNSKLDTLLERNSMFIVPEQTKAPDEERSAG